MRFKLDGLLQDKLFLDYLDIKKKDEESFTRFRKFLTYKNFIQSWIWSFQLITNGFEKSQAWYQVNHLFLKMIQKWDLNGVNGI